MGVEIKEKSVWIRRFASALDCHTAKKEKNTLPANTGIWYLYVYCICLTTSSIFFFWGGVGSVRLYIFLNLQHLVFIIKILDWTIQSTEPQFLDPKVCLYNPVNFGVMMSMPWVLLLYLPRVTQRRQSIKNYWLSQFSTLKFLIFSKIM